MSSGNGTAPRVLPPSPPLSARERDVQRIDIINTLNQTARQVNFLTPETKKLRDDVDGLKQDVDVLRAQEQTTYTAFADFRARSFWQRLRWLLRGN